MTSQRLQVDGRNRSGPRTVRHWVQERLEFEGATDSAIDDLRLIASELCSNAVEHMTTSHIIVMVDSADPEWWILVLTTHADGDTPPDTSHWTVAQPDAPSGRGLGIVRTLSDHVAVTAVDHSVTITCWRRRQRS